MPLKEPAKVAAEFAKFFGERTGRRPFSSANKSPNVMENLQHPIASTSSSNSLPIDISRPSSPLSVKNLSPEEDLKSKLQLMDFSVPGKLIFDNTLVVNDGSSGQDAASNDEEREDVTDSGASNKDWVAPESWAIIPPLLQSSTSVKPASPSGEEASQELSAIRIYKIDSKHHRTASIVNMLDNFFQPSVLLACPMNTTALEICTTLTQKYFTSYDSSRYRLYVTHGGIGKPASMVLENLFVFRTNAGVG